MRVWIDLKMVATAVLSSVTTMGLALLVGAASPPKDLKVRRILLVHDSGHVVGRLGVEDVVFSDGTSEERVGLFLHPSWASYWIDQEPSLGSRPEQTFLSSPRQTGTAYMRVPDQEDLVERDLAGSFVAVKGEWAVPTKLSTVDHRKPPQRSTSP